MEDLAEIHHGTLIKRQHLTLGPEKAVAPIKFHFTPFRRILIAIKTNGLKIPIRSK